MASISEYSRLNLNVWPFVLVPDEEYSLIWADRKELKQQVEYFLNSINKINLSTIRLMWAYVGSGKSHTLKYIKSICDSSIKQIVPIYIEFPKSAKSFVDVYKEIVQTIDFYNLKYELIISDKLRYLSNFCKIMNTGVDSQKNIAVEWIKANKISLRDIRNVGLHSRIEDSNFCIKVISELIHLVLNSNGSKMFLIMIDEIQRISELTENQRRDINISLHSLFNLLPRNLTFLFSFSVRQQESMYKLITPELKSRSNKSEIFELKLFNIDQAQEFISDLINFFKIDKKDNRPFDKSVIKFIVNHINENLQDKYELKPRDLIEVFNILLTRYYFESSKTEFDSITKEYVIQILDELR